MVYNLSCVPHEICVSEYGTNEYYILLYRSYKVKFQTRCNSPSFCNMFHNTVYVEQSCSISDMRYPNGIGQKMKEILVGEKVQLLFQVSKVHSDFFFFAAGRCDNRRLTTCV